MHRLTISVVLACVSLAGNALAEGNRGSSYQGVYRYPYGGHLGSSNRPTPVDPTRDFRTPIVRNPTFDSHGRLTTSVSYNTPGGRPVVISHAW